MVQLRRSVHLHGDRRRVDEYVDLKLGCCLLGWFNHNCFVRSTVHESVDMNLGCCLLGVVSRVWSDHTCTVRRRVDEYVDANLRCCFLEVA